MAKKTVRLRAPEGLTTTGIYTTDADGKPVEYPVGATIEVDEDFNVDATWPGRAEVIGEDGAPISKVLIADNAEIEELRAQLAAAQATIEELSAPPAKAEDPKAAKVEEKKG